MAIFGSLNSSSFGQGINVSGEIKAKDFEVSDVGDDTISSLKFSPLASQTLLASTSWDQTIRVWQINENGNSKTSACQRVNGPILSCDWHNDGTKLFSGNCENGAHMWDLSSNEVVQVAQHTAPVKSVHWITAPNYSCLLTTSWDKSAKLWDLKSSSPVLSLSLPERAYCSDVLYPMAVICTANKQTLIYSLEGTPREVRRAETTLKHQLRSVAVFKDKSMSKPAGFALGSIEGRVYINNLESQASSGKDSFSFKCHRSNELVNGLQEVFPINGICFHPIHNTFATIGGDGHYLFWDKDTKCKLSTSEKFDQPLTSCAFDRNGQIFAYALGYDWAKGHEYNNPQKKAHIFLHPAFEELKSKVKK